MCTRFVDFIITGCRRRNRILCLNKRRNCLKKAIFFSVTNVIIDERSVNPPGLMMAIDES